MCIMYGTALKIAQLIVHACAQLLCPCFLLLSVSLSCIGLLPPLTLTTAPVCVCVCVHVLWTVSSLLVGPDVATM